MDPVQYDTQTSDDVQHGLDITPIQVGTGVLHVYNEATSRSMDIPIYIGQVSYDPAGGTGAPSSQLCISDHQYYAVDITPSTAPTKSGVYFIGWRGATGDGEIYYESVPVIPGDIVTFTAVYGNMSNITLKPNGASGSLPSVSTSVMVPENETAEFTIPGSGSLVNDGYTFDGWSEYPDGNPVKYAEGDKMTIQYGRDVTLYAVWQATEVLTYYHITFDMVDAPVTPPSMSGQYSSSGSQSFILPYPDTWQGHTFLGWYRSVVGSSDLISAGEVYILYESEPEVTLYAFYSPNQVTYNLTFNLNGAAGTAPTVNPLVSTSGSATFTLPIATSRTGFDFMGWCADANGTGSLYPASGSFTTSQQDNVLYAIWGTATTPGTFWARVLFDVDGGVDAPGELSDSMTGAVASGMAEFTITTAKLSKSGYTFMGWTQTKGSDLIFKNPGDKIQVPYGTTVILYASWKADVSDGPFAIPKVVKDGATISFDASGSRNFTRVSWNFGDGTTSDKVSGTHVFAETGTYVVELTVYNGTEYNTAQTMVVIDDVPAGKSELDMRAVAVMAVAVIGSLLIVWRVMS